MLGVRMRMGDGVRPMIVRKAITAARLSRDGPWLALRALQESMVAQTVNSVLLAMVLVESEALSCCSSAAVATVVNTTLSTDFAMTIIEYFSSTFPV